MATPKPYKIALTDKFLEETHQKLKAARFPGEVELPSGKKWTYGTPLETTKSLTEYWTNTYDWRKQEALLNEMPQFTLDVEVNGQETIDMHFVHKRSTRANAIPLLFVHGWPGNFTEVSKILPLLTEPVDTNAQAYHVVAPSLPGFVFSSSPTKPGFGLFEIGATINKLMAMLGYNTYVAQGGDWGSFVARVLAIRHSDACKAIYLNMFVTPPPSKFNPIEVVKYLTGSYTAEEIQDLHDTQRFIDDETGYQAIQSTRPQTLNFALTDSPVGMLAWIREKLNAWTDNYPWTSDEIITWVMLYYATAKPATHIYREFRPARAQVLSTYISIPVGVSVFPKELYKMPKAWASKVCNLVSWEKHSKGGHFAATEQPEVLVADLNRFIGKLQPNLSHDMNRGQRTSVL